MRQLCAGLLRAGPLLVSQPSNWPRRRSRSQPVRRAPAPLPPRPLQSIASWQRSPLQDRSSGNDRPALWACLDLTHVAPGITSGANGDDASGDDANAGDANADDGPNGGGANDDA